MKKLRGVYYKWKEVEDVKKLDDNRHIGVIAQDVIKVFPELVNQRPDGYYAVDYDKMIGLLIEVVKVQEERIKNLENKLNQQ